MRRAGRWPVRACQGVYGFPTHFSDTPPRRPSRSSFAFLCLSVSRALGIHPQTLHFGIGCVSGLTVCPSTLCLLSLTGLVVLTAEWCLLHCICGRGLCEGRGLLRGQGLCEEGRGLVFSPTTLVLCLQQHSSSHGHERRRPQPLFPRPRGPDPENALLLGLPRLWRVY